MKNAKDVNHTYTHSSQNSKSRFNIVEICELIAELNKAKKNIKHLQHLKKNDTHDTQERRTVKQRKQIFLREYEKKRI